MRVLLLILTAGTFFGCGKEEFQEREWLVGEDDFEVTQLFDSENNDVLTLQLVSQGFCIGGSFLAVTVKADEDIIYQETIKQLDTTIQFSVQKGKKTEVITAVVPGDGLIQCVRLGNVRCILGAD